MDRGINSQPDDRRISSRTPARRHATRVSTEPEIAFAAQLRDFLRRNMNWFLCGALGLLLLQDVFGTHGVLAMRRSQQEANRVQNEIRQLDEQNRKLQDHVKSLKSDPAAIERIAREEMGLARPGEYIFKDQSSAPPASENTTPGVGKPATAPQPTPSSRAAQPRKSH